MSRFRPEAATRTMIDDLYLVCMLVYIYNDNRSHALYFDRNVAGILGFSCVVGES